MSIVVMGYGVRVPVGHGRTRYSMVEPTPDRRFVRAVQGDGSQDERCRAARAHGHVRSPQRRVRAAHHGAMCAEPSCPGCQHLRKGEAR